MYRILVASDSHGNTEYIERAIDTIRQIDLIVHLGDYTRDAEHIRLQYPEYAMANVRGNCDFMSEAPEDKIVQAEGFSLLLTHGHLYGVKSGLHRLELAAKKMNVQGVLFGHTHQKHCEWQDSILYMNPGSGSFYGSSPAIGIIEIENNRLRGSVL